MVGLLKQLTIPHMSSFLDLLVHSFDDSDGDTNNVDIKSKKRLKSNNMNLADYRRVKLSNVNARTFDITFTFGARRSLLLSSSAMIWKFIVA